MYSTTMAFRNKRISGNKSRNTTKRKETNNTTTTTKCGSTPVRRKLLVLNVILCSILIILYHHQFDDHLSGDIQPDKERYAQEPTAKQRSLSSEFNTIHHQVIEMKADKESTVRLIDKVLYGNITLPYPYINMGMPKIGTSTLNEFFQCSGIDSSHYICKPGGLVVDNETVGRNYCADCMTTAVQYKLPPLASCGGYVHGNGDDKILGIHRKTKKPIRPAKAFTQLDRFGSNTKRNPRDCSMPQISLLEEIHQEHPQATFIWISRPLEDWNESLSNWHTRRHKTSLREEFTNCDLPGLPSGVGKMDYKLFKWVYRVQQKLRGFVKKHPSHALIELDLYDPNNDKIMTQLFGFKSKGCWGHANKSDFSPKEETKKRQQQG